jgi:hypothetical protein
MWRELFEIATAYLQFLVCRGKAINGYCQPSPSARETGRRRSHRGSARSAAEGAPPPSSNRHFGGGCPRLLRSRETIGHRNLSLSAYPTFQINRKMTYCQSVGSMRMSRRADLGDGGLHVVQSLLQVVILVVYITHLQLPLLNVERVNSSLQVIPGLLH